MLPLFSGRDLPSRPTVVDFVALAVLGSIIYAAGIPSNPPGFFIDESSIAYNAHRIAETGCDEHGQCFPLYFRAFDEYKNPVHVYLLAAVFKVTGPSIGAARSMSAALGVATALMLGLLAMQITKRRGVGVMVAFSALLTPWLFELSRAAPRSESRLMRPRGSQTLRLPVRVQRMGSGRLGYVLFVCFV